MKRILDGYLSPYEERDVKIIRRQDAEDIFTPYGVIYISKVGSLLEHKTFYQSKTIPFYIERWQKYEVDDIYDLMCIEAIMKATCSVSPGCLNFAERRLILRIPLTRFPLRRGWFCPV